MLLLGMLLWLGACGGSRPGGPPQHTAPPAPIHWTSLLHVPAVVDLTPPRSDGTLTVAAGGRLSLLRPGGQPTAFARGSDGYQTDPGPEPYVALGADAQPPGSGCSFTRDTVYALRPTGPTGVLSIDSSGQARQLAALPGVSPNGIAFDETGRFGYRLLVTARAASGTSLYAIDCAGRVATIASGKPGVEGGIAVAPRSFGAFGGYLIAPDENSGRLWAFGPDGSTTLVATSPLPHGGDIGVESLGFVPASFTANWSAYLADRRSPGNAHPGTDSVLRLSGADLTTVDIRPGDLLAAAEGGALTVAIRCAAACSLRYIADGPYVAHAEGHIVFAPATAS